MSMFLHIQTEKLKQEIEKLKTENEELSKEARSCGEMLLKLSNGDFGKVMLARENEKLRELVKKAIDIINYNLEPSVWNEHQFEQECNEWLAKAKAIPE